MQYLEEFLTADDGHEIPVRIWRPNTVDNILVIAHGMAEYCERYAPMADWLTEANIAVVALNHRGHGMDCEFEDMGYFADHFGWQKVVNDLHQCIEFAKKELPTAPITLFGHSMGSFISQSYFAQHSDQLAQLILGSTTRANRPKLYGSLFILSFIKFFKGKRATSKLVDYLSFGQFNRKFKPNRTDSDWINRDDNQVDEYIADPFCGFSCSLLFWQDFITGILSIDHKLWPDDKPIHFLSGSDDSVGELGKGVGKLVEQVKAANKKVGTFKLYPQARHELVNEVNALEVWQDIRDLVISGQLTEKNS